MALNVNRKSYSRLDQLFTLLENGTTQATRSAAAKQLGLMQKKHPHELYNLMERLLVYVRHKDWDTRIAAADAIKYVVSEVPQWNPAPAPHEIKKEVGFSTKIKISNLNIMNIVNESELLLCSPGDEFEFRESDKDSFDKITRARQRIEKKMGLTIGGCGSLGISSQDLFNDDDLVDHDVKSATKISGGKAKRKPKDALEGTMSQITKGMSSREKNRVKRKVKMQYKDNIEQKTIQQEESQPNKKMKTEEGSVSKYDPKGLVEKWPFEVICEDLLAMLFSPVWEWRHGACLAFRNILNVHASGAGIQAGHSESEMKHNHGLWLEDATSRMLCVLVLDRFGDFVSDQMIAPVRESCAQALAVTAKFLDINTVSDVLGILINMTKQPNWEVRHAGFLGIKYTLAVRPDLQSESVHNCIEPLISGLEDKDGDIQSVCADALIPITKEIKTENSILKHLFNVLCDSIRDMDELSASTKSLLDLMSKLITSLPSSDMMSLLDVKCVLSRLWIFTKHPNLSVKKAALQTITVVLCNLQMDIIPWFSDIAEESLWCLVECCIFEVDQTVQIMTRDVWGRFCEKTPPPVLCGFCLKYFDNVLSMAAQPDNVPYPQAALRSKFVFVSHDENEESSQRYIGGAPTLTTENNETRSEAVARTRWNVARMLGVLCGYMGRYAVGLSILKDVHTITLQVFEKLNSRSALHRIAGCMTLTSWWESGISSPTSDVFQPLFHALNEDLYFSEISALFFQVQSEIRTLLQLVSQSLKKPLSFQVKQVYSLEDGFNLHSQLETLLAETDPLVVHENNKRLLSIVKEAQDNNDIYQRVVQCYLILTLTVGSYNTSVDSPSSVLMLPKITPVIRPLMEGLKKEDNKVHRGIISRSLTLLIDIYRKREPCPNPKLIRNICLLLCGEETTPNALDPVSNLHEDILKHCKCSKEEAVHYAIITLLRKQALTFNVIDQRKKSVDDTKSFFKFTLASKDSVARLGALNFLKHLCDHFKTDVLHAIPELWKIVINPLQDLHVKNGDCLDNESKIETLKDKNMCLVVLEALIPILEEDVVIAKVLDLLPSVSSLIFSQYSAVRYVCSRCFSVLTKRIPNKLMENFVLEILPDIDSSNLSKRMGIVETISNIIDCLESDILPYSVLLIVPLLGRMSDQNHQIRLVATRCFASLMQYLPVESSVPNAPGLSDKLTQKRKEDRRFLEQLLDTKTLDEYPVPVPIKAKLRPYQEDGVKWIAFLKRYKLHGILCDDMGLGKTLQTICILASACHESAQDMKNGDETSLPSLVICPPTLTGHWVEEVEKFCDRKYLNPLHYVGTPTERAKIQSRLPYHNLVIASYEVVRNDVSFFSKHLWNYCILDEGHMIRNAKNKLSMCVKSLKSSNRLILTGTPIQNNVLELWSLFDFLMPGFLGTEQEFNYYYGKPILASRDAKSSSKEQEEGVMAMESLHKQVLPFMLRRMKEDVLQDLPPKIIQDYYCALTPLQVRLYEDFSKTKAKRDLESSIVRADKDQARSSQSCHVFQAMQYLQKVCNHPALVLTTCHPEYKQVSSELSKENSSLHDIQHSAKLIALQQLLIDCGIGVSGNDCTSPLASKHRALIFCQHKSMLDIVEHDLLRKHMKTVSFLRLDGSVPANSRHNIVSKFNHHPTIDLLLLTTKVGGLGLNLTGADVVIFIEHDWNPTVDMQAMDRAHRIGQKRVVNVYRLITKGTLEEKIMSLQRFKIDVASTIVSVDNSSLRSMGTNQLLDLFTMHNRDKKDGKSTSKDKSGKGLRALMDEIGDLWDQNQYDTEYNLDSFMEKLIV